MLVLHLPDAWGLKYQYLHISLCSQHIVIKVFIHDAEQSAANIAPFTTRALKITLAKVASSCLMHPNFLLFNCESSQCTSRFMRPSVDAVLAQLPAVAAWPDQSCEESQCWEGLMDTSIKLNIHYRHTVAGQIL